MNKSLALALTGIGALLLTTACGGSGKGGSSSRMSILETSNGFGRLLPYRVYKADALGLPTANLIEITRVSDITENVTLTNPILSPVEWPTQAVLPNGDAGNHFIYTKFKRPIGIDSVLDASTGATVNFNLTGTITVLSVDPIGGATIPIPGRAFIGGQTYGAVNPQNLSELMLETWVEMDGGKPVAVDVNGATPGLGFPGTESLNGIAGAADLLSPNTFLFIPDADGDLSTHETFPAGVQIRMRMSGGVTAESGFGLEQEGLASSTVGSDTIPPEVSVSGQTQVPVIIPGNGDINIDPETSVIVEFTEPLQLRTVGELYTGVPPGISAAIQLEFGPSSSRVQVPYSVLPFSPYDLSRLELIPIYAFPGSGPTLGGLTCGSFSTVTVTVNGDKFQDLSGNLNTLAPSTNFTTAEGPGLVNAPVLPDALYVARGGTEPAISVVDLNGFGQSCGNPTYDIQYPIIQGNSNFPNNPNVAIQGSIIVPPLTPGSCTFNGGSEGVFSLTKDSSLRDVVAGSPILTSVGDMALGHALDNAYNNALPFGCQAGGGNICAETGFKVLSIAAGGANTLAPSTVSTFPIKTVWGAENLVSWSPHPNPPALTFPPLCLSPMIGGQEPTSTYTILPPPTGLGLTNLLTPGNFPLGRPDLNMPPTGILSLEQNAFMEGPMPPQSNISLCLQYMIRQQIGQFLYVIDRVQSEVVVFNSNRFTVIDRIWVPDPTSLAMSPNLEFLAVTNQNADLVSFIDTDPTSSTFHQVIKNLSVGNGPIGIAWEPGNEDILVCNQADNTVSIISAFTLNVRRTIMNQLNQPFEVAITPRQLGFGFQRGIYWGYILNGDGSVAIFESGPNGINGWGFDDVIGRAPFVFANPKTLQPDVRNLNSAVWIVHEDPLDVFTGVSTGQGGGAVTNLGITSGTTGLIPLDPGFFSNPQLRDMQFDIIASIGEADDGLTGIPVDIAFDCQRNMTALTNWSTQFSAGFPLSINGKSLVKPSGGAVVPVCAPQFIFLAVPNSNEGPGVVDVLELASGYRRFDVNVFDPGTQSIPVPNASGLADFIRQ